MTEALPEVELQEIATLYGDCAHQFSGKTFLISGGCGFLGRYFVEFLEYLNSTVLKKPCTVIVLDNLITASDTGAHISALPNVTFLKHDVAQPIEWKQPVDYVIHAAGVASPHYYRRYPLETVEAATLGTRNMLELARQHNVEGFLFLSSSEIYGDPDPMNLPTNESYRGNVSCIGPRACYDESKRLGETFCSIFHDRDGLAVKIARPFNVYGPAMMENDYRVLPNFARRIKGGQALQVYGDGTQTRTYCYISDAINGFLRTLVRGTPGEAYNIGHSHPELSVTELAAEVSSVQGDHVKVEFIDYPGSYPSGEPMRRCPDLAKAQSHLGYQPTVELRDGLRRFFDWASQAYTGVT